MPTKTYREGFIDGQRALINAWNVRLTEWLKDHPASVPAKAKVIPIDSKGPIRKSEGH